MTWKKGPRWLILRPVWIFVKRDGPIKGKQNSNHTEGHFYIFTNKGTATQSLNGCQGAQPATKWLLGRVLPNPFREAPRATRMEGMPLFIPSPLHSPAPADSGKRERCFLSPTTGMSGTTPKVLMDRIQSLGYTMCTTDILAVC